MKICISILNAGEGDHFIRGLIIENEDDVAQKYKSQEVADDDAEFFGKVETCQRQIQTHNDEAKKHLVDQDYVGNVIDTVDLK